MPINTDQNIITTTSYLTLNPPCNLPDLHKIKSTASLILKSDIEVRIIKPTINQDVRLFKQQSISTNTALLLPT